MSASSRVRVILGAVALAAAILSGVTASILGICGPFTDVNDVLFCPYVLEIYVLEITSGATASTFDPASPTSRLQSAAFLSRTVDRVLLRGSRRAALDQFWTLKSSPFLGLTTIGIGPRAVKSDGEDLWIAQELENGSVARVHASDGRLLDTWFGATAATGILVAGGRVFTAGAMNPGSLYMIDPGQAAGTVTTVATNLGYYPRAMAFDGVRIWIVNGGIAIFPTAPGSVSIVTPGPFLPWTASTVAIAPTLGGILYDGANIWVTCNSNGTLIKLNATGSVLQTVSLGAGTFPQEPAFDGTNIWVPNGKTSVSVVRASTGTLLATLTGNGLELPDSNPLAAAFDGQRVMVINGGGERVSLWKAANLAPLGSFATPSDFFNLGVCSDGVNFWVTLRRNGPPTGIGLLARF